jgi:hypothetical protein
MTTTQTKPTNPNEAKPMLGLGKPAAIEAKAAPEAKVSLKAICLRARNFGSQSATRRNFLNLPRRTSPAPHGNGRKGRRLRKKRALH